MTFARGDSLEAALRLARFRIWVCDVCEVELVLAIWCGIIVVILFVVCPCVLS